MSADSLIPGVVAATLARLDEAMLPLRRLLAAPGAAEGELAGTFMQLYHQQTIEEFRAQGYKSNDIVEIADDPSQALQQPKIAVNGSRIDLEVREMLLAFILARQTRSLARNPVAQRNPDSGFLSVSALLREIDRVKAQVGLGELWQNAIDTDVHKTISGLRNKLLRAGFNRNLIEGRRKIGYRLSIPAWNLIPPTLRGDPNAGPGQ